MGVTTFTQEYKFPVAPGRMFKALVLDSHNIMPKLAPHAIKSTEIVEGDGGAGTVKGPNLLMASPFTTLIKGDLLVQKLQSITYVIKFEASSDGGSIMTTTCEHHTKDDAQLKEEDLKNGKENAHGLTKIFEDYLLANPDVYA